MTALIYCFLFALVFTWSYQEIRRGEMIQKYVGVSLKPLLVCLGIGLLIRVIVACTVYGYATDVNTFKAWAGRAASVGLAQFYEGDMFVDYPPGYVYVLYMLGKLRSLLSLSYESPFFLILLKSPAMLADLAVSYLLFRWSASRGMDSRVAASISLLYLCNPATVINSAGWGQVDSFFMLWLLLCFEALQRGAMRRAAVLYAVALLVKPQALLFAPLLLLVYIRRGSWRSALTGLGSGALTFAVLALPFTIHKGPFWIASLYFGTLSSYPYASLNAFNLMSLLGGNFVPLGDKVFFLTYQTWSVLFMAIVLAGTVYVYLRSRKDESQLVLIAGLLMTGAFLVLTKMHERYLFYALPLLLAAFVQLRDRRLLYIVLGLSLTHFLNVHQVLLDSLKQQYFIPNQDALLLLLSAAHIGLFGYLAKVVWALVVKGESHPIASGRESEANANSPINSSTTRQQIGAAKERHVPAVSFRSGLPQLPHASEEKPLQWKRSDSLLLGGLVLVYAVLAFWNLGSLQAPETGWQAAQAGEKVIFNLGSVKPIERINSFSGIGDGSFTYEVSEDGRSWSAPTHVTNDVFKVFMWQVVPVNVSGQYVRLTVVKPAFKLNEIAVYEKGSEKPAEIQSVTGEEMDASAQADLRFLYDEQAKAAYRATFLNGAYFDEIYHARTAYEHLHQLEPYESTHPPLGKILISAGIALFGMNPFGWRVVGTLFGIAMLPIMYVFGKRLFGRSEYAFAASFLMACDGLHFVQTRIATIDVYGVFFIMLMFYFMYRVVSQSLFSAAWHKIHLLLALSGLCFGLGVASKWIALYGGCGLAILYFLWLYSQYRHYRMAAVVLSVKHKQDKQLLAEWQRIRTVFPRRTAATIAWCAAYFVVVPAVIYVLSYIPFMRVPGPGHSLSDVLSYQKHMLSYHSQLTGTHPFSSSWWQWPVMSRPVWYYGAAELAPGTISSIVAIGNPLVWWVGFAAILWVTYRAARTRERVTGFVAAAFFSQYIPWMLVPRMTFLYHYFAMVPFSILAVVYYYKRWKESGALSSRWLYVYLLAAAFCFVLFYPVLSGLTVSRGYAEHVLKWLPQWQFF